MNKREQIYKAAIKLFNQYGFDKTPTSQIAKEASVATGTLFHYFKTKEDLINSLYLKCKESLIESMICGVVTEDSFKSKFKKMYMNLLHWGLNYTDEFLFFQHFSNSIYIYDKTRKLGKNKFEFLMNMLKEGIEKKIIKNLPQDYIFTMTSSFIMSNTYYFIENRNMLENMEFLEETFDYIWNSIKI